LWWLNRSPPDCRKLGVFDSSMSPAYGRLSFLGGLSSKGRRKKINTVPSYRGGTCKAFTLGVEEKDVLSCDLAVNAGSCAFSDSLCIKNYRQQDRTYRRGFGKKKLFKI
jgi:hypothetical protein